MHTEGMLIAKNLWCVYDDRLIFKEINLSVLPGKCICIQGKNGSGKTSLLNILAGFLMPYIGTVIHSDELSIRMVPHSDNLTADLTIEETEKFWRELFGESTASIFFFPQHTNALISSLSRGEKQKLALNKLHHGHSNLWLLDEPFANLDIHSYKTLGFALQHQLARGGSIIFTCHEPLLDLPFIINHSIKL